jgi:putative ABC transport system permease protein
MGNLLRDVRYAVRVLAKSPGFTAVAVLALALGIGANTAIFSVVKAVLLSPLPYPEAERLVWIWETNEVNNILQEPASLPNYDDWSKQSRSFEGVAAFDNVPLALTGEGEPERIEGAAVSANFFPVLGVEPTLGRGFLAEENTPGKNRVVVLSRGLWQRRYGSNPKVVGQTLTLNGNPYTVVGVAAEGFKHPDSGPRPEMWVPLAFNLEQAARRGDYLSVVARLKPGAGLEGARAEMGAVASRLAEAYPATNAGWGVTLVPLHERLVGDVRTALWVLTGVVGFLLLIACANVANLLLVRAASRRQEIAVRTALGAGRLRLVRQFLSESVLLALAGGALGLLFAMWGIDVLLALGPSNMPRLDEVGLDGKVLAFTLLVSLATGVVFGLLPALYATGSDLTEALKEGSRSSTAGVGGRRVRNSLVVAEMAIAVVMLTGAGLMIRSFARLQEVDPGFKPERIMSVNLALPGSKYKESPQLTAFFEQLLGRVSALPGVESAAAVSALPLGGGGDVLAFVVEGRPAPPPEQVLDAEYRVVTPDYFATMGIPLARGEGITARHAAGSPAVVVVNETMAHRHWPGEDPIGKRINLGNPETAPWRTVIGVVRDIRHEGLDKVPYPQMYSPYAQFPRRSMTLVARAAADPLGLAPGVRREVAALDKDLPLYNVRTMEQVVAESVARQRFTMLLIAVFAGVGLLLASVGIYGVISYTVSQRRHELSVRLALGAQARDIVRMVVGQGMLLALGGIGAGLAAAFLLTRVMASLLYGVSATDPLTFALVPLALAGVALLASLIPARRATRVDPAGALRYQ